MKMSRETLAEIDVIGVLMDWDKLSLVWQCYENGGLNPSNLEAVVPYLKSPVLLVGAGFGLNAATLQELGFEVVSIDSSPKMAARAKEIRGVDITVVDGEKMPFSDNQFGSVLVSTGVVSRDTYDSHRMEVLLQEVSRVLAAEANLFIAFIQQETVCHNISTQLGLYGDNSNNFIFSETNSIDDAKEKFAELYPEQEGVIKNIFKVYPDFIGRQADIIKSVQSTLLQNGLCQSEALQYIKRFTGFGRNELNVEESAAFFGSLCQKLDVLDYVELESGYTAGFVARKMPEHQ